MSLSSSDDLDDQEVRVASIHPSPAHSAAESSSSASSRAPSAAFGGAAAHMHMRDDSGNSQSAYRTHLSPSMHLALDTGAGSALEFSRSDASSPLSSIHSGRSSVLDGATRPSPQLLHAINHTSPREQQQQHTQPQLGVAATGLSSRGNSAASRSGTHISPPSSTVPNVAGRMPPNLALERPALPVAAAPPVAPSSASKSGFAPPTFTATSRFNLQQQSHSPLSSGPSTPASGPLIPQATRGRSWSMGPLPSACHRSPAGAHAIAAAAVAAYANLTPPIGAGAYARRQLLLRSFERSALIGGGGGLGGGGGSGEQLNEEEAEDELLLGASASLRALRNRAHSQPGTQPIPMDLSDLEPMAWQSKGSRLVIYCASGILFLLIFCFFIVVALRMAAHTKYNNHLCVARDQERQAAHGAVAGTTAAFEAEAKSYADTVQWAPNYDASSWDRAAFLTSLKSKWATDQSAESSLSPKAQSSHASALFDAGQWLSHLRLHHLKVIGTHNSYHQPSALPLSMHQYSHASLPVQLANYRRGVRQLELDLHIIPNQQRPKRDARAGSSDAARSSSTAGFVVYHLQWLDDRTSCYCLSECLDLISLWSTRHPAHFPLYISFEIKSRFWEDVDTGLRGVTCQDVEDVEAEIAQVFPREKMVTPWEIRGGRPAKPERKDKQGRVVQAAQKEVQPQFATVRDALQAAADIEARYAASLIASASGDPSFKPAVADYPTMEFGWPRLVDSLGKIVVVWLDDMHNLADQLDCMQENLAPATATPTPTEPKDGGKKNAESTAAAPATTALPLDSSAVSYNPGWFHSPSRLLFIAQNSMDAPYASFVTAKHPSAAMLAGLVRSALTRGLMIRTMTDESVNALPDPGRFAAALRSGAQILSTDFEECVERTEFHQSEPSLDGTDEEPQGNTGTAEPTQMRAAKMLFDTHIHDDAHEPHAMAVPTLLPSSSLALSAAQNASSTLYCEHLPSEWPFECAQLAAPFFCESALYALRLQRDFAEATAAAAAAKKP